MAQTLKELRARYRWNAKAMRYQTPAGTFVSQRSLKQALNSFVRRSGKEIEALSREVSNGTITVKEWQRAMVDRVKSIHLAQAAAAKGGWAQMSKADFGRVGQGLRGEYKYLRKFAKEVSKGKLAPGTIIARSSMYASRGAGIYENTRRAAAVEVFTEERRKLGQAEHCPTCVEEAGKWWVTVGTLKEIGDSECMSRCRCRFLFR